MARRGALFVGCALVGLVLTYGSLYAFTSFGLAIVGIGLTGVLALRALGDRGGFETLGVLAGVGFFWGSVPLW